MGSSLRRRFALLFAATLAFAQGAPQVKVVAGTYHTLALGSDGRLWAWGLNDHGQLGDGTTQDRPLPSLSRPPAGVTLRDLAGGESHSLLLTRDGRVFACGRNDRGQLGTGVGSGSTAWVEIPGLDRVIQVACGLHHSYALRADGSVVAWGDNRHAQAGPAGEAVIRRPRVLPLPPMRAVAAGATHGLALDAAGEAWGWGDGRNGALGASMNAVFPPFLLSFLPKVRQIAAGDRFALALLEDGTVQAWGRNDHGQLGDGTRKDSSTPRTIPGLSGITALGAGMAHGLAQGAEGRLWSWGDNNMGQLGHGAPGHATHPMQVNLPASPTPWTLCVGGYHAFFTTSGSNLLGVGYNEFNQLGDWSYQNRRSPVKPRKDIP